MCRIILCTPQREEDKLIDHEEARRRQTHPDITNMISPVLTHIQMKFYYRKYMLKKKISEANPKNNWMRGEQAEYAGVSINPENPISSLPVFLASLIFSCHPYKNVIFWLTSSKLFKMLFYIAFLGDCGLVRKGE